ncbi:MAG TPA: hypothetical protein PLR25_04035 [Planctomycetaceae bacterium]|nr:hypothetical protein [Planctomycetaceae bacterium]
MNPKIRSAYWLAIGWLMVAAAVGIVICQLFANWLNLCGTSAASLASLAIGFAVGMLLMGWVSEGIDQFLSDDRWRSPLRISTGLVVISLCWLMPSLLNATLLAGCETIGVTWPFSSLLVMLFPALVVAIVIAAAGVFFRATNPCPETPWINSALVGVPGVALMLLFAVPGLSSLPFAIAPTLLIGIAVACCILFSSAMEEISNDPVLGRECVDGWPGLESDSSKPRSFLRSAQSNPGHPIHHSSCERALDHAVNDHASRNPAEQLTCRIHMLAFLAAGMLLMAVSETLCQFMPSSLPVMIQTACLTALALAMLSRPLTMKLLTVPAMHFFALLTLAFLPILFLPLTDFNLSLNTRSLAAVVVLLLRSAQFAIFVTAAFVPAICVSSTMQHTISSRNAVLCSVSGVLLTLVLLSLGVSPTMLLVVGIVIHATACLARIFVNHRRRSESMNRIASLAQYALPVLSLLSPLLVAFGTADSSRMSSLLFSDRTIAAVEHGIEQDLILQSHANRLISTVATQSGEITVWRRTGNVFEFQRNGMPIGRVSNNTSLSPQPIEDILPAIMAMVSHAKPSRVLLLGDDTGVCLRTCSHFPVREIVAVRSDRQLTQLAQRLTWSGQSLPPDQDQRVRILHEPATLAVRRRELSLFDVVIATGENLTLPSAAHEYTTEFYQAVRSRMTADAVFCQRFRQNHVGSEPLKETMATLMTAFKNVGVIQTLPGEILLLASDSEQGLIDPDLLARLQRDHVRREIATAGWDWAQVAILPLVDARDPLGIFSHASPPSANTVSNNGLAMTVPFDSVRPTNKQAELNAAFAPHEMQILAAIPDTEDHHEVKRRLSALAQEMEILAGMPDQPWTYRKSLQMEMKQSPRPAQELVESGRISQVAHPLDVLRRQYFISLGKALTAASRGELNTALIGHLDQFTDNFEPLITHFAHYEIVRLHELSQHPSPAEEFRHRLHIVFFTAPTDASVRPVISALQQLVDQPTLIADDAERYDMLNSLVQKMIERWEARTVWEPRSALRVQNDVDLSVTAASRAMAQMETLSAAANVEKIDFYRRRRFISTALINPLRDYRDRVLAHRMKSEKPVEQNTEDPNDVPLLINSGSDMNTN